MTMEKLRLGISRCLLGENVRYDGMHKRNAFLVDTLGPYVEFVPVCPEVECGLSIPREAMRLVGTLESPRLMTVRSGHDLTAQMQDWIGPQLDTLEKEDLCGFVFKARSPAAAWNGLKSTTKREP